MLDDELAPAGRAWRPRSSAVSSLRKWTRCCSVAWVWRDQGGPALQMCVYRQRRRKRSVLLGRRIAYVADNRSHYLSMTRACARTSF